VRHSLGTALREVGEPRERTLEQLHVATLGSAPSSFRARRLIARPSSESALESSSTCSGERGSSGCRSAPRRRSTRLSILTCSGRDRWSGLDRSKAAVLKGGSICLAKTLRTREASLRHERASVWTSRGVSDAPSYSKLSKRDTWERSSFRRSSSADRPLDKLKKPGLTRPRLDFSPRLNLASATVLRCGAP
jgi:hypothetical protein